MQCLLARLLLWGAKLLCRPCPGCQQWHRCLQTLSMQAWWTCWSKMWPSFHRTFKRLWRRSRSKRVPKMEHGQPKICTLPPHTHTPGAYAEGLREGYSCQIAAAQQLEEVSFRMPSSCGKITQRNLRYKNKDSNCKLSVRRKPFWLPRRHLPKPTRLPAKCKRSSPTRSIERLPHQLPHPPRGSQSPSKACRNPWRASTTSSSHPQGRSASGQKTPHSSSKRGDAHMQAAPKEEEEEEEGPPGAHFG